MHAGTKLHLTPCARDVVHLLKEHGNSRSKISNVSISVRIQTKFNFIKYKIKLSSKCDCGCRVNKLGNKTLYISQTKSLKIRLQVLLLRFKLPFGCRLHLNYVLFNELEWSFGCNVLRVRLAQSKTFPDFMTGLLKMPCSVM